MSSVLSSQSGVFWYLSSAGCGKGRQTATVGDMSENGLENYKLLLAIVIVIIMRTVNTSSNQWMRHRS